MESTHWIIDDRFNDELSEESLNFVFTQSERALDDTLKIADSITARTNSLVPVVSTVLIAISAYIIQNMGTGVAINKLATAVFVAIYLISLTFYMVGNILPKNYCNPGVIPKDLINSHYLGNGSDKDKIPLYFIMNQIENNEKRINQNMNVNQIRWGKYRNSVIALAIMPVVAALVFVLSANF